MDVIIFESPTKKKTVWDLMKSWKVPTMKILATVWHFMEIVWKKKGKVESVWIDLENLKPNYKISKDKKKIEEELRTEIEKAEKVYIATDPDWEWMVIWKHIYDLYPQHQDKFYRILFEEISPAIINNALKNAAHDKDIDWNPAKAWTWRAIFDRVVGWWISSWIRRSFFGTPYLKQWISFWRAQTPALKIIYDRELEIESHSKKFYSTLHSNYKDWFEGNWIRNKELLPKEDVLPLFDKIKDLTTWTVSEYKEWIRTRSPYPPFETASLLRSASTTLGYSAKQTNRLLKFWYDNWITSYPRVDTIIFPAEKNKDIRTFIENSYWNNFLSAKLIEYKDKIASQGWHAAIWPVYIDLSPDKLLNETERKNRNINVKDIPDDFLALYDLIWKRTIASQMTDAVYDTQALSVDIWWETFKSNSQQVNFKWFLEVYSFDEEENEWNETWKQIKVYNKGDKLEIKKLEIKDHETKPPSRFNESRLLKKLKELWIWRPSTYENIISKIIDREYVKVAWKAKQFTLADKWRALIEISLKDEKLKEMIDFWFTAKVEKFLDELASWNEPFSNMNTILKNIYMAMDACGVEFDTDWFVENKWDSSLGKVWTKKNEGELLEEVCPICWMQTGNKVRRKAIVSKKNWNTYYIRECESRKYNPETKETDGCSFSEFEKTNTPSASSYTPNYVDGKCPICSWRLIESTTKTGKTMRKCEHNKWDAKTKMPTGCPHVEWVN